MLEHPISLADSLNKSDLLIIDTRSSKEYAKGHISNSVNLDLFAYHWIDTTPQGIESFNRQLVRLFSFTGLSGKRVIFYDNVSGMLASRGLWLAQYMSHNNSALLDGGLQHWISLGLPLETKFNHSQPIHFKGKPNDSILTGYKHILDNLDNLFLIDARDKQEYDGIIRRASNRGHIPNAINIDWTENLKSDGTLQDNDFINHLYDTSKDTEIITYCHGAYRAANTFVALKKAGYQNVKVYLGSWGEWGNIPHLPVSI